MSDLKIQFEPNLDYQIEAINAVCDLFRGQEICRTEFTVTQQSRIGQTAMSFAESGLGIGNRLTLLDDEILVNLHAIQLRHGLTPSPKLESGDFTVEMETGTGKTYVYLRTAFELNKRYGFTKFIIVVPSVAIREGTNHTIETLRDHLKEIYAGVPFDAYIYDSATLGQVLSFATSQHIQIMIMTVGAINKFGDESDAGAEGAIDGARSKVLKNVMYRPSEKTGGEKPIDLIRATRPILIVDEPQSVEGGLDGKGKRAMARMSPLCNLRYSATPKHAHHMIYRLDAVDAYERKLVKQIEVAGASIVGGFNKPYVRFIAPVSQGKSVVGAKIEIDAAIASGVARKVVVVSPLDKLEEITKREIYRDFIIGQDIRDANNDKFMELRYPGGEEYLRPGQTYGGIDELALQRQMINRTIKEHFEKEKRLRPLGIKVLSLFFVDAVEKYRKYDEDGNKVDGVYAGIFEEEFKRLAKHPDYKVLFTETDISVMARNVHDGRFSIDRKKVGGRVVEMFADTKGTSQSDDYIYRLIMQNKEELLSLQTPLKFIFSHSALREGWDNPNVFQICVLREMASEQQRRQTIGRGLRICVNQEGQRVRGFDVNTLTVIASESYESYAEKFQKEIEDETGVRFGIVERHEFAGIPIVDNSGEVTSLGFDSSQKLWDYLFETGLINGHGKIQDKLRKALKDGSLQIPSDFADVSTQVIDTLLKLAGRLEIKNADERRQVKSRGAVLNSDEFKALWDRIKFKTTYRVQFDNEELLNGCIAALRSAPGVMRTQLQWRKANLEIGRGGVNTTEISSSAPFVIDEGDIELPDILTHLQDTTQLTRRSICRILVGSGRLDDFKRNPQQFIEIVTEIINRNKKLSLVDGIKYQRLGDAEYFAQELFEANELTGYLKNMIDANKSVYEQVMYQSEVERSFADELEKNEAVKVYAKLPSWFEVVTPLGPYVPDWAVLVANDDAERLYFVVETKGSRYKDDLRSSEYAKIQCGRAHFEALKMAEPEARYVVATTIGEMLSEPS